VVDDQLINDLRYFRHDGSDRGCHALLKCFQFVCNFSLQGPILGCKGLHKNGRRFESFQGLDDLSTFTQGPGFGCVSIHCNEDFFQSGLQRIFLIPNGTIQQRFHTILETGFNIIIERTFIMNFLQSVLQRLLRNST
jgi:hypothetical protein